MVPHKILISVRLKTHELLQTGECKVPAVDDSKAIIGEVDITEADLNSMGLYEKVHQAVLQIVDKNLHSLKEKLSCR